MLKTSHGLAVQEESDIGFARRTTLIMAQECGLDEVAAAEAAIIASEAARNLVRYARNGHILLRPLLGDGDEAGIEILAVDSGPGIADVELSFSDGFSTGGTSGTGLGAIRRLATRFDIHTLADKGTIILAQRRQGKRETGPMRVGAVNLPIHGERECGDAWSHRTGSGLEAFLVVDGLGHGVNAAEAANEAVTAFERCTQDGKVGSPAALLETVHLALRGTRGAAGAIAVLDRERGEVRYAGIGNIAGTVYRPTDEKKMASMSGILGAEARKFQEFTYPWSSDALLILHSDGLQTQWNLARLPGLMARDPGVIAAAMHREWSRGRDDVTVLVASEGW